MTTRPAADSIADPGPLGLACLRADHVRAEHFQRRPLRPDDGYEARYLSIALVYGGVAQMLAGMWEFKKNNTFGAVAFTSYGAFWVSLALFVKFWGPAMKASAPLGQRVTKPPWVSSCCRGRSSPRTCWSASFRTNKALASVFSVLFVVFLLLVFGNSTRTCRV